MIEILNLSISSSFGDVLIKDVSFFCKPGTIHVISAPAGGGKTIVARALCGLLPEGLRQTGTIRCPEAAYVGEDPDAQIVTLTVADEVASAQEFACVPSSEIVERSKRALQLTGLEGLESRNPWTLSGGQRQRLAIACAIACKPGAIVLDSPCANIDPVGRRQVYKILRDLADDGTTVVIFEQRTALPEWADELSMLPQQVERRMGNVHLSEIWSFSKGLVQTPKIEIDAISLGKITKRLDEVSMSLDPGKIHLLTGPNGCGKTSIMAILSGAARPTEGKIRVDGKSVTRVPDGLVSWSQQNPERQFVQGTIGDEIEYGLNGSESDGPLSVEQLTDLPGIFGFSAEEQGSPYCMSANRKRQLSVLLALLSNKRLLLLDEPTANTKDTETLNQILRCYADGGGTILISSHDAHLIRADRVIEMRPRSSEASVSEKTSRAKYPPLNPVTIITILIWLIILGVVIPSSLLVAALSCVCLLTAVAFHQNRKIFLAHLGVTILVAAAFALIALRGNWSSQPGVMWQAVAKHASLGSIMISASLCAGCLTTVTQLADAVSQRLKVSYTWGTLALAGTSIAFFLRTVSPLVSAAVRLRKVRYKAGVSNWIARFLVPVHSALPLFVDAIRYSQRLSLTLSSRHFGRYPIKTYRVFYLWRIQDALAPAALSIFTALIINL